MISNKKTIVLLCAGLLAVALSWSPAAMASEPFIGEIKLVGFNFAPRGYANCEGQLLPISQNSALFSLLGTTFGGDGRSTFALPDMRGRVAVGQGNGPGLSDRREGQRYGAETKTLSITEMPSHNHAVTLKAQSADGTETSPGGHVLANDPREDQYGTVAPDVSMASASIEEQNVGGGLSFAISQPSLVLRYVIALVGIFPSRN